MMTLFYLDHLKILFSVNWFINIILYSIGSILCIGLFLIVIRFPVVMQRKIKKSMQSQEEEFREYLKRFKR